MCEAGAFRSIVSPESRHEQLLDVVPQACDNDDVEPYLIISSDSANTTINRLFTVISLMMLVTLF